METQKVQQVLGQQLPPTKESTLEKTGTGDEFIKASASSIPETETLDIEHVPVQNDPREWSSLRKVSFQPYLEYFYVFDIYSIACYPSIDCFCIYDSWTQYQYPEP